MEYNVDMCVMDVTNSKTIAKVIYKYRTPPLEHIKFNTGIPKLIIWSIHRNLKNSVVEIHYDQRYPLISTKH